MARVKRGVTSHKRHKRLLNDAEGRKRHEPQAGQAGARGAAPRAGLRDPGPQAAQARHAAAVDHPDQRGRAPERHHLREADRRPQEGRRGHSTARSSPTWPSATPRPSARSPRSPAAPDPWLASEGRARAPERIGPRTLDVADDRGFAIPGASGLPEPVSGPGSLRWTSTQLTSDLDALRPRAVGAAAAAPDTGALDALEVEVLGKKGELTAILRGIGALPAEDRPKVGAVANHVRTAVEAALAEAAAGWAVPSWRPASAAEAVDVTTPGRPIRRGSLHPIMETTREIAEVFAQFGFVVYEGPEIEDDVTNFQMLNIPPDHPARDLWDTLYLDVEGRLLRTHTSPGQIRVMHQERPPIRALLPGRCFRYEAVDASHASEFFQVEGLMIDEGTSMADLKGLLDQFAHAMFGAGRATRFRPGYYPFTEPSVAFDILCVICDGEKCPACSRTGWMTILGAGMVHPVVLRYGGIDPERYQGFAFGMGVERIANLRHAVGDLRLYMEDDLRFLGAFR